MEISGMVQSPYDSGPASSAPLTRAMAAPQYLQHSPYSATATDTMAIPHHDGPVQHHPFNFSSFPNANINVLVPGPPNNYLQQHPLPRLVQPAAGGRRTYPHNGHQAYVEGFHSHSPPIKPEPRWNPSTDSTSSTSQTRNTSPTVSDPGSSEIIFDTEVDTLMKAIQAKSQTAQSSHNSSSLDQTTSLAISHASYSSTCAQESKDELPEDASNSKNGKRRYQCQIKTCMKSFYQKTHLDIHQRAHTGFKPYACKESGCGRSFSQLGNLRTHERRHTGERPYQCEICGKRFAQRGNVRAHKIVHEQAKPYLCRLDECGKQFTQLGNLKSHQNKFHAQTIRDLTSKFASIKDGDVVGSADKELWEYFANLYKNSNKGIKGRGKDRKVGANSMALDSSMRNLHVGGGRYPPSGGPRGHLLAGGMDAGMRGNGKVEEHYGMYDADDVSQSGSRSAGGSSVEPFDDAPSDGYEGAGRGGDLAFGDRIY